LGLVAATLSAAVTCGLAPALASAVPTLDTLMTDLGYKDADVQRVRRGELVTTTTKETNAREIATVMAFLVKAPVKTLVGAFEIGAAFRNDPQVKAVTEIRGDGTVGDFKAVVLPPKEAQHYLNAAPGDALNLSSEEIAAFQALKGSGTGQAQAEEALRRMLLARYQAYRARGLAGIAPYARSGGKSSSAADDLRRATEAAHVLKAREPAFYAALLNYPADVPAGLTERFFCVRYEMGGRPNFTLRHRLVLPVGDAYVAADREYYVSREYNDVQAIAALLPVEDGTIVLYRTRTTTDQLGGFGASAKQAIGRRMMTRQISEIFEKTRAGFAKQ
jgi:hypothetical protein